MLSLHQPHKRNKIIAICTTLLLIISTVTTATYAASSIKTNTITMEELKVYYRYNCGTSPKITLEWAGQQNKKTMTNRKG